MPLRRIIRFKVETEKNSDFECTACGGLFVFGSDGPHLVIPLGRDRNNVQTYAIVHDNPDCINVVR